MAVAITHKSNTGYISIYNGQGWSNVALNTGEGLVAMVNFGYPSTPPVITAATLSTDGAAAQQTSLRGASETESIMFFWPSITAATQNLTLTCSSGSGEGLAALWTVTGHNTTTMLGNSGYTTTESTPISLSVSTGSALLECLYGSDPQNQVITGAGGAWSTSQNTSARSTNWSRYNTTPNSGALSINVQTGSIYLMHVVEILAGGTTTKPAYYYAQQ